MNKWADKSTPRGLIESIIEPIISGGAQPQHINNVVDRLLAAEIMLLGGVPDGMILITLDDAEAVARFAFNNAGKGLRAPVAAAGERVLDALHMEKQHG